MPRVAVTIPLNRCKTPGCSRSPHSEQADYCAECVKERKKAYIWTEETYRSKGFVEVLGTIRFKRPGTKERLQKLASEQGVTVWELLQKWAWER